MNAGDPEGERALVARWRAASGLFAVRRCAAPLNLTSSPRHRSVQPAHDTGGTHAVRSGTRCAHFVTWNDRSPSTAVVSPVEPVVLLTVWACSRSEPGAAHTWAPPAGVRQPLCRAAQTITTAAVVREETLPEPPATACYVEVTAVHARLRVAGVGPPLLLLHGLGCSSRYFQPLQRLLATDFTVYSPDLPGHGHSEKPVDRRWQLRALTEWVAAFITTLDLERPVIVGHSLGGGLAVELAARYPQLVHGLVLLAPTGVPDMPPLLGQLPRLLLDGALEPRRLFPLIVPAYLRAGVRRMLRLAIDQTRHPRRAALRRIRLPMLVLRGSRDPIVTRAAMVELAREASAAQLREVPGAAHALHVSHPRVVWRAITASAAHDVPA